MDLFNPLCVDLEGCVGSSASAVKNVKKQKTPVILDSGKPLVPSAEFISFPADISHLVGDYVSAKDREYVETAFAGKQPITLCLSQDVGSKLASCWSIGFLPPNQQWEPSNVKIDKEYLIQDYEGCLLLLEQEDSNYCRVAIEVLVVKLSNTSNDFPSTLNALQKTIKKLQRHLSGVKHVVFSIHEHVSCCFTLSDAVGKVDKVRQSVDKSKAIFEIIEDLHTCWSDGNTLIARQLFAFYFKSGVERTSERYLAKFVIPLNSDLNQKLFDDEASKMLSTKIMWVCSWKSLDDFIHFDQNTTRLCHAFYLNAARLLSFEEDRLTNYLGRTLCLQDNPFVERIVIKSKRSALTIELPRPDAPLTNASSRSSLIELSLKSDINNFDLTQLNNDYFPHLAHLSIIDGNITGHLDSQSVPRLKTLRIELGFDFSREDSKAGPLIPAHTQAIVDSGRPWQLVAAQDHQGWSLASYDEPIPNPQDDGKEDAPPSPPFIRDLLLVMEKQRHKTEYQLRLNGKWVLKAAADNLNRGLLEWAPERVEKITVYSMWHKLPQIKFNEIIPGKTRILRSLTCYDVEAVVDGAALPNLQSLEVNGGTVTISGAFPQLQTLSFNDTLLASLWQIDAPLLKSFNCDQLLGGNNLILRPQLLPHLFYLRIVLRKDDYRHCLTISIDEDDVLGLSHVNHVVFGKHVTKFNDINLWQLHKVSHLELTLDTLDFPKRQDNIEWLCETLTLHFYESIVAHSDDESDSDEELSPFTLSLKLTRLKKLTVTEIDGCRVLLDSQMAKLTDLFVPSPESFGPNLICTKLTYIHFTGKLSPIEKDLCLDRATYVKICARPEWVYFENSGEANEMFWGAVPNKMKMKVLPLDEYMEDVE